MDRPELPTRIRRIRASDGPVLRDLRLRSLTDSPEAFGQRAEDAATQTAADWESAARVAASGERRAWFLAEATGGADDAAARPATLGLVLGRRRPSDTLLIFSMWVDPAVRRSGLGRGLIEAAERWAGEWGARRSVLWVFATNEPALRFYGRLGFRLLSEGEDARTGAHYGAVAMEHRFDDA